MGPLKPISGKEGEKHGRDFKIFNKLDVMILPFSNRCYLKETEGLLTFKGPITTLLNRNRVSSVRGSACTDADKPVPLIV